MNIPSGLRNIENRGVSPVIAVILMVAITVILSAVIGTYVLSIGNSLNESPPQASFSIEQTELPGDDAPVGVKITHTGGEEFSGTNVHAVVEGGTTDIWSETESVTAGDAAYVVAPPSGTVTVAYDTADSATQLLSREIDGDASSTVRSYSYGNATYDTVRHSGFDKWSRNPRPTNCAHSDYKNADFDDIPTMIGGRCEFGGGDSTQRQYDLPAGTYKIGLTAYYEMTWDNEQIWAEWNGNRVWTGKEYYFYNGGLPTSEQITFTVSHSGGQGTLRFDSDLNSPPNNEAWGINSLWIVRVN